MIVIQVLVPWKLNCIQSLDHCNSSMRFTDSVRCLGRVFVAGFQQELRQYAVKAQTSLAPLSWFYGSRVTTVACMCTNFVDFRVMQRLCHCEWNWLCVSQHPWQRTRDHGVWRLTSTAHFGRHWSHFTNIQFSKINFGIFQYSATSSNSKILAVTISWSGKMLQISCFCGFIALGVVWQKKGCPKGLKCSVAAEIPHQTICQGALVTILFVCLTSFSLYGQRLF